VGSDLSWSKRWNEQRTLPKHRPTATPEKRREVRLRGRNIVCELHTNSALVRRWLPGSRCKKAAIDTVLEIPSSKDFVGKYDSETDYHGTVLVGTTVKHIQEIDFKGSWEEVEDLDVRCVQ